MDRPTHLEQQLYQYEAEQDRASSESDALAIVTAELADEIRGLVAAGDLETMKEFDQELVQIVTPQIWSILAIDPITGWARLFAALAPAIRAEAEKRAPAELARRQQVAALDAAEDRWASGRY